MNILVAGGTGGVGMGVVRRLLRQRLPITVLTRNAQQAKIKLGFKVNYVEGSANDKTTLKWAMQNIDTVICAIGSPITKGPLAMYRDEYLANKNVIEAAKEAGVTRFIWVSSLGAGKPFHLVNFFWLSGTYKGINEKRLMESGMQYTIVRPGGLKNGEIDRPVVIGKAGSFSLGLINREDVAELCAQCLHKNQTKNKIIEICTSRTEKNNTEIFAQLNQVFD